MPRPPLAALLTLTMLTPSGCAPATPPPPAVTEPPPEAPPASAEPVAPPPAPEAPPPPPPAEPAVDFVALTASSQPERLPTLAISSPRKNAELSPEKALAAEVKLRVKGWETGEGKGIVRVVLDSRASLDLTDPTRPVHLSDLSPGGPLEPGQHLLVALALRPNGEAVKPSGQQVPAAIVPFFVGPRRAAKGAWKEGSPLLVLAPPPGPVAPERALVDFYVLNAEIGPGKYVVHAQVSGPGLEKGASIDAWSPWQITAARAGRYAVKLSLFHFVPTLGPSASQTTVSYASQAVGGPGSAVDERLDVIPGAAR